MFLTTFEIRFKNLFDSFHYYYVTSAGFVINFLIDFIIVYLYRVFTFKCIYVYIRERTKPF